MGPDCCKRIVPTLILEASVGLGIQSTGAEVSLPFKALKAFCTLAVHLNLA